MGCYQFKNPKLYCKNMETGETKEVGKIYNMTISPTPSMQEDEINITARGRILGTNMQDLESIFWANYNPEKSSTKIMPERYIINDGATILFWKDGAKTVVKRAENDEFNARLAFLTAFFQHYSGMTKNKANKYLANLQVESDLGEDGKSIKNNQKSKFNVGDKVKLISADGECEIYKKYIGKKGIIKNICIDKDDMANVYAHVLFEDGITWFPFLNNLKKIGGK